MKHRRIVRGMMILALVLGAASLTQAQGPVSDVGEAGAPLGTAFTYQGRLTDESGPVDGRCDLSFELYDEAGSGTPPSGGTPLGTANKPNHPISDGTFAVRLNFGADVFTGEARWLQIGVNCGDGDVTLSPRQPLTPAPYALALPGLWTQQNGVSPNVIGGYSGNQVAPGAVGATISGGGQAGASNEVSADYGTVAGGMGNTASGGWASTVGGGDGNTAGGWQSSVAGGYDNTITRWAWAATIGGGAHNTIFTQTATIGGGHTNTVTIGGNTAVIAGGNQNSAEAYASAIGGGYNNKGSGSASVIAGGHDNIASGGGSSVGGGRDNSATSSGATIGGGKNNVASGEWFPTVGGGEQNVAGGSKSVVAGGYDNVITDDLAWSASIGGGAHNVAEGYCATVPGGMHNLARGRHSFAAGQRAKANSQGCFVWGDSTDADVTCDEDNAWVARASGGVTFYSNNSLSSGVYLAPGANQWTTLPAPPSDQNLKENIVPIDPQEVLSEVAALPVSTWTYESESDVRHMGPMAQDFYAAFGLGKDDEHIHTIDADGVALASIQGLYDVVQEKDARISKLEDQNAALERQINDLETRVEALEELIHEGKVETTSASSTISFDWLLGGGLLLGGFVWWQRRQKGGS